MPRRPLHIIVISLFALLLIGSIVFYKERMLFLDAPHILFRIINNGTFQIEVGRYGSFITQAFPLLGTQLHLPLTVLMVLYSLSFTLFAGTTALLLLYKYKRTDLALLLAFYSTLLISDAWFWTNNEVHQGIAWLLLAFAITAFSSLKKRSVSVQLLLFTVFFYLAICTHPLIMLIAAFLWVFLWLDKQHWPYSTRQSWLFTILMLAIIALKYYQSTHNWYDQGKMDNVRNFHLRNVPAIFRSPQLVQFIKSCITRYWAFTILTVTGWIALLSARRYLLLAVSVMAAVGYVLVVCITFGDVASLRFYIESEYAPLTIIGVAPFVYYVMPRLKAPTAAGIIAATFIVRLLSIANAAPVFIHRVQWLATINRCMQQKHFTKLIVPNTDPQIDSVLLMNWGTPVESILLSAIEHQQPQRTFFVVNPDDVNKYVSIGKDTLIGCFEKRPSFRLNAHYFSIDTTGYYKVMTLGELVK